VPMYAVLVVLVEGVIPASRLQYQEWDRSGYSRPSTMASPDIP
jgi:hypothetical protein